jgi:signal transduction histidine kinase
MQNSIQLMQEHEYTLVVEDSAVQAKKLRFFLENANIQCEVSYNAKVALKLVEEKPPALIISDIVMPEMDGYEFCSLLKSNPSTKEIPVILLTSLNDPLDIIKGLQAGADNFITKPYDENYLLSRIQYLLINRNFRQSGSAEMFLEIMFRGRRYAINSEKKQILDLLLSVYEAAVQRNDELINAKLEIEQANESLVNAYQELEAFTRTVSHDLRNPLQLIMGYLDLIKDNHFGELPEDIRKPIEIIKEVSDNMNQLINDLLKFARSGMGEIEKSTVNLTDLAESVVGNLRLKDSSRNVIVEFESEVIVYGDAALLGAVMENLVGNAWKYSSRNPDAKITLGTIRNAEGQTEIFVGDNGAGFNMDKAAKLFQPFQRFHSSKDFEGTGVGLATVKRIVDRHGGTIRADSAPGIGSTFYFTLPPEA